MEGDEGGQGLHTTSLLHPRPLSQCLQRGKEPHTTNNRSAGIPHKHKALFTGNSICFIRMESLDHSNHNLFAKTPTKLHCQ